MVNAKIIEAKVLMNEKKIGIVNECEKMQVHIQNVRQCKKNVDDG